MLDWVLIFKGVLIGILVAAPIGPINLICIQRTLRFGPLNGFLPGIGAALGDGVFALAAALGLTMLAGVMAAHGDWLKLAGAVVLVFIGAHTLINPLRASDPLPENSMGKTAGVIMLTLFLTLTNPTTMMGFIAIFTGFGGLVAEDASYGDAMTLTGGVMAGSLVWWLAITQLVNLGRTQMGHGLIRRVNQVMGGLIIALGFGLILRVGFTVFVI